MPPNQNTMKCPGQDTRYWDQEAIYETECPNCKAVIEFFKDDPFRPCKQCGHRVKNPRLDLGCALHCPYAKECLGSLPEEAWQEVQEAKNKS